MAPAATTLNLHFYRDWILLLFCGHHETQRLTEAEIADKLREARVDASVTEVHAALQMWGAVSTTSESAGSGLLSPPPEHEYPSTSHTPLNQQLSGSSPYKGDELFAFIELYGLPKGVPMPRHIVEDIEEREQRQLRSQMLEKYLRTIDDPFTYTVVGSRGRRRQAAPVTESPRVSHRRCDLDILDVDDGIEIDEQPSASKLDDPRDSQYFSGTRGRKDDSVAKCHTRGRTSEKASYKDGRRIASAPPKSTSNTIQTLQTPPREQTQEPNNDEDLAKEADELRSPTQRGAIDFETQLCQSHGSNYSSKKRMRRFSTATDDDEEGSSKRFRRNLEN